VTRVCEERPAVQDETVFTLRFLDGLLDDAHHYVVRDQRAGLHRVLGADAVGAPRGDCGAQHVPGGKVAKAVVPLDCGRLRALAATGRAGRPGTEARHM